MLRRVLLSLVLILGAAADLPAQEAAKDDEMLFVQKLRERGYADLALNYLETRLAKDPKYAAAAPLEIALTRAAQAQTEGDAAKRVSLYEQARTELTAFLAKNPMHPRAAAIRLETAGIAGEQGRTQLARAMSLPEGDDSRPAELRRAVAMLDDAAKVIEAVAVELKNDKDKNANEYERGLLLVSQGRAYLALSKIVDKAQQTKLENDSSASLKTALGLLEGLSEKTEGALRARVLAWWGRALSLNAETTNKVISKFDAARQAATDAKDSVALRQIGFFEMLHTYESEQDIKPEEVKSLVTKGETWLRNYPGFKSTPEGAGVLYILARMYYRTAGDPKATPQVRGENWGKARAAIRDIEASDNEYTNQAQQLKIDILISQKAFERDIKTLITFDDLYMRALYEHHQLGKDAKKFDTDAKRKAQQLLIIDALERALRSVAAQESRGIKTPAVDLAGAYYLLTGYYLTLEDYPKVAKLGEEFVRKHPRERYANTISMFAARALSEIIKKGAGDDYDQMVEERERLFKLAQFMSERWPADKAGQFGSFLVALHLIKKPLTADDEKGRQAERKQREEQAIKIAGDVARFHLGVERAKQKKFLDTIVLLRDVKPDFPNFTLASYQLALAALQLDKDDAERAKLSRPAVLAEENAERAKRGEKPLDFGKEKAPFKALALQALERIPDTVDLSDGETALFFFRAKTELGFMYYPLQQYDKMEQLATKLLPLLDANKTVPDMDKGVFQQRLNSIKLYAVYGKADVAYKAGNFDNVAKTLDPIVKEIEEGKYPELKEDTRLLNALLGLALRSNLQSEKGQRAMQIMTVWKKFEKEGENTIANVLTVTVAAMKKQIEELKKKGDKEKLDRVVNSLSAFLAAVKGDESKLSPDFRLLLGQCYVPIGRYPQAIELLEKYPEPKPNPDPMAKDENAKHQARYKVVKVLLIRAKRLQAAEEKDPAAREKALKKVLDEDLHKIMAPTPEDTAKKQPGWGKRDINALMEEVLLYMDMKAWGAATNRANALLQILGKQLGAGGAARDRYFEAAHCYVVSFTNSALALTDPKDAMKRENYLTRTAKFYNALLSNHPTLGGEEHKEHFDAFLKTPEGLELQKYLDKK